MNGAYSTVGGEFLVNSTTPGIQSESTIAALASGGFVICWTDASGQGADTSGTGIKAQLYDAAGNPVGAEFLVNTQTLNAQNKPSVAALASGGFVVTWTDASATGPDTSNLGVKAQIFDASGAKVGSEFLVNTTTALGQTDSTITSLASGGFVVSWVDGSATAPDASGTGVRAQIYSATGAKVGGEFLVNTVTTGSQNAVAISALASGGFIASWVDSSNKGDPSSLGIKAQLFSATGAKVGSEFLVNTTTLSTQDSPWVTTLANGSFVVVWRDLSLQGDTSASGVKGQIFDATGAKIGTEFQVNTTTYNSQDQPVVTAIVGGGFAVSWRDNSNLASDASGFGIKMQIFDALGAKSGSEFQVNSTTSGNQEMPAITALASGALVVTWSDSSTTGIDPNGSIKAQILAPAGGAISDIALSSDFLSEVAVDNIAVGSLVPNGATNASYSFQLLDDSTDGAFAISGNQLMVVDSLKLDYETSPTASVTVRASDTFGNTFDKVFSLAVQDASIEDRYSGGNEILVNTTIAGAQQQPFAALLADGRYVVTWADGSNVGGDTSGSGIKAQILDAAGNKLGSEFLVNTQTLNNQDSPAAVGLASGGFVVTWTDSSGQGSDASSSGIKAQMFDASGAPIGTEFLVNQSTLNAQKTPSVAALATGGFVITWADASGQGGDSSVTGVKAQIYDQTGQPVGGEFLVNTNTANGQDTPVVASLVSGGFVVSWHDSSLVGGDTSKDAVKAQIFDASGARVGGEFLVNTQTRNNQQQEAITGLVSGGFAIAWADSSQIGGDSDGYGIKVQVYDESGAPVGGETLVNTTTAGPQIAPTISSLSGGGFVVSWNDYSGAGSELGTAGIKAQIFTGNGDKVGGEFVVESQTLGAQVDPVVLAGLNGDMAVGWTDYSAQGGDNSGTAVKFKIFDRLGSQGGPPPLAAGSDTVNGTEDQPVTIQPATLLANDVDINGLDISLTGVTAVTGGTVAIDPSSGDIIFTPFANFNGTGAFTYGATDIAGNTAIGHVAVNIAPINDPPTAMDDRISVSEDGAVIQAAALLANDTDLDIGDKLSIVSFDPATSAGTALTSTSGNIAYAPGNQYQYLAAGSTAVDSFSYTIADRAGLTSTATVSLTIVGANDAPTSLTLQGSNVDENAPNGTVVGTLGALDVDQGDVLTYSLTNNAGGRFAVDPVTGILSVANGSLLDYETAQSQTIVARATDLSGAYVSNSFTIGINNLPEPKSWTGDNGVNVFTAGSNDLWTINGLGGNDILTGNASSDVIYGGSGNDVLDGGTGADTIYGGTGNDTFYVDNIGDKVVENYGEGTDLVYASVDFTLDSNIENLTQTGAADIAATGNDLANTITGNDGANIIRGGAGGDLLIGGAGNDTLYGEAGGDFLQGGDGNDVLIGGAGADELTGGAGNDTFVFDSLTTSADRDKVKDFVSGEDIFKLSRDVFTAFAGVPLGGLPASAFVNGTAAVTADQHLIYQQSTGNLYYDPDGVGGAPQIQIALLSTRPVLTSQDFTIG